MATNMKMTRVFSSGQAAFRPVRASVTSRRCGVRVEARNTAINVGVWGTKAGMMSYFTPEGVCIPATVVALEEGNVVTQIKTEATDGYNAVQVGYKAQPERKITKPEMGHLKKAGVQPMKYLREYRLRDADAKKAMEAYKPGDKLDISKLLKEGDVVSVSGTSIGKGFAGGVKKFNHGRGPMSHGSQCHRAEHSIGQRSGRVFPGLPMFGQLGNVRTCVRNLEIVKVDLEKNAIVIKGALPGKSGSIVEIVPAKIIGKNWP